MSPAGAACTANCPGGYKKDGAKCLPCEAGTAAAANADACTACTGTEVSAAGAAACAAGCDLGYYADGAKCLPCATGT